MRKVLITLGLILALLTTSQATDATAAWNSVCASYNFGSFPQGIHTTFQQAYSGSNFSADLAGAVGAVSGTCGTHLPPIGGTEPLNDTLLNW